MADHRSSRIDVVDLTRTLIANACVNDATDASAHESRNAEVLAGVLDGPGLDVALYEGVPGRANLVARIEGREPGAPSLLYLTHTDVAPVEDPGQWRHDPFGGEVVDGVLWGRGAVKALSTAASMAAAIRNLADRGVRPAGTVTFAAVADQEQWAELGTRWLMAHEPDVLRADWAISDLGAGPVPRPDGANHLVTVADKALSHYRITATARAGLAAEMEGLTPALVIAAEVVLRLHRYRPPSVVTPLWRTMIGGLGFGDMLDGMLDESTLDDAIATLDRGLARPVHAMTHTLVEPISISLPDRWARAPGRVAVDVRVLALEPDGPAQVMAFFEEALGELADRVAIEPMVVGAASQSPVDTPLWDVLTRVLPSVRPGAHVVPSLALGPTTAHPLREQGTVVYGVTPLTGEVSYLDLVSTIRSDDERIDVASLNLMTSVWEQVVVELMGG